jgi:hypothetical protein
VRRHRAVRSTGQNASIGSAWRDDQTVVGDLTEGAMHWLLRGRGWQALAREVAWAAVAATREPPEALDWLVPLVEDRLAGRLEEVRSEVREAIAAAGREYVRRWPNDAGAPTAAELAGRAAAERALGRGYYACVSWASSLLLERRAAIRRRSFLERLRLERTPDAPVVAELPASVIERAVDAETVGWPDRTAA